MNIRPATPADAMDIAHIHVDTWQKAYRGIVPDSYLDNLSLAQRGNWWATVLADPGNSNFVFVADDDLGQPVGFATGGPQTNEKLPYDGELHAIYVLKEHQGKGIGRALLVETARELKRRGSPNMLLWVLQENAPSRRFYEAMGGQLVGEQEIQLGGARLVEVGYGWPDINGFGENQNEP